MSTVELTDCAVPQGTHEQRARALERANEIRMRRARVKERIRAGVQPVAPLIVDPPDYLRSMRLFDLLLAVRQQGRVKVGRFLRQHEVGLSRELGALTERQRSALVGALPEATKARTR